MTSNAFILFCIINIDKLKFQIGPIVFVSFLSGTL